MTKRLDKVRVRQLDEALAAYQVARQRTPPSGGWVKAIRKALGMSQRQLADRVGVSRTAVDSAERNEGRGKIRLDSLTRLADGLDCDLVYSLVPRESLQATLDLRATELARRMVETVSTSMELEEQGVPDDERQRQIAELASELLASRSRDFWDD